MSRVQITANDLRTKNGYRRVVARNRAHASLVEIGQAWQNARGAGPASTDADKFRARYIREWTRVHNGQPPSSEQVAAGWREHLRVFGEHGVPENLGWRDFAARHPNKAQGSLRALWAAGTGRPVPAKVSALDRVVLRRHRRSDRKTTTTESLRSLATVQ